MLNFNATDIIKENIDFEAFDQRLNISEIEIFDDMLNRANLFNSYAIQTQPQLLQQENNQIIPESNFYDNVLKHGSHPVQLPEPTEPEEPQLIDPASLVLTDHQNSAFYDLTSSEKQDESDDTFFEEQGYKSTVTTSPQSPVSLEQQCRDNRFLENSNCSLSLEFEDLNDAVSALLKKAKDSQNGKEIKRRQRKNKD